MPRPRRRPLLLALLAAALIAALVPAPAAAADGVEPRQLYRDGPDGRYLMGGQWLFRLDPGDVGLRQGFHKRTSKAGWTPVSVPNAWNAGDDSVASMQGSTGWYRKDFRLPSAAAALQWVARFESVNYRTRAWLNGRPIGTNRGAYIPFELRLAGLRRGGLNRLVVRVDSRRRKTDFPPSGLSTTGTPTGGWWNYGGLLREVYLRRVDTLDWAQVRVRPELPCRACPATVRVRAVIRNVTGAAQRVRVRGRFGERPIDLGARVVAPFSSTIFERAVRVQRPRLWSPAAPNLYGVRLEATAAAGRKGRARRVAGYRLSTGIRSIKVVGGRLLVNGEQASFRGVGMHEDDPKLGFAVDNSVRERLVANAKDVGATVIRTHYPFHPYMHELADRLGLLIWSEIPVYANRKEVFRQPVVRALAAKELRRNIETNQNHPSVMLWSIANELSSKPGPAQSSYIARAARLAKELDPTRPVGIAVAGYPSAGCQPGYRPLDVIGVNEYFGWYPGPGGQLFDRTRLSGYLDDVRRCYPDKAVVVSEFGAEANRDGPVEEKGTFAHQQDFVNFHLGVMAGKPWLSGAIYWALEEFRVRPGWEGGNPRPSPPVHQKGVITYGGAVRKPAFADLQRLFRSVVQFAPRR